MSGTPLISIAMCTYNGAKYLQQQVDSLLSQTVQHFEVIVVDDISTDGTWELLQDIARKDQRFHIERNEKNLGPTKNFQRAMQQCRGEYIAPCDQDDIWEPQKLEKLLDVIGDHDMAYCNSAYIDSTGRPMGSSIAHELPMHRGKRPFDYIFFNTVSGHALLMRKDLLDISTPFPEKLYYDWWLALCASMRNGVYYLDEALVQFRRHSNAHSNLGLDRSAEQRLKRSKLDKEWLDERRLFLSLIAESKTTHANNAQYMRNSLDNAINTGGYWSLRRAFWQLRHELPKQKKRLQLSNVLSLSQKFVRRIKRIRSANGFSMLEDIDRDTASVAALHHDEATNPSADSAALEKIEFDRSWIEDKQAVLEALMKSDTAYKSAATDMYAALLHAIERKEYDRLQKAIWRHRSLMPKEYGLHSLGAMSFSKRLIRRIKRVYGEKK
jgi:glycosyltransferase involved in cell wall biosynthesis